MTEGGQTALGIVEQDPRVGSKVAIVNLRSVTGTMFVEGRAEVVKVLDDHGDETGETGFDAEVCFPEDRDGRTVRRFVDPSAQADPQKYCDGMNQVRAEMRAAAEGRNGA